MRAIVESRCAMLEFSGRTYPWKPIAGVITPHSAGSYCRFASQWLTARHFVLLCRELTTLRQLTVAVGVLSDTQLAQLRHLSQLQRLHLTFYDLHPPSLISLARDMPKLRQLCLCWREHPTTADSPYNSHATRLSHLGPLTFDIVRAQDTYELPQLPQLAWTWNPEATATNASIMYFARVREFTGQGSLLLIYTSVREYIHCCPLLKRALDLTLPSIETT
jgi:hypothetical protein